MTAASKDGPCWADAAAWTTGARLNHGTLVLDNAVGDAFVLQRVSTGRAVKVQLRRGVFPVDLAELERSIRSRRARGQAVSPEEVDRFESMAETFMRRLLDSPAETVVEVQELAGFVLPGQSPNLVAPRSDIINRDLPCPQVADALDHGGADRPAASDPPTAGNPRTGSSVRETVGRFQGDRDGLSCYIPHYNEMSDLTRSVDTHKALAHPVRQRLVAMLREGELCVCQMTAVLELAASTVSAHLADLKRAGLFVESKSGRFVSYAWSADPAASAQLAGVAARIAKDPQVVADAKLVRSLRRVDVEKLCRVELDLSRVGIRRPAVAAAGARRQERES